MLIINSKDELLLGHGSKNYQFIGGHVEDGESFDECVVREIKEETGIDIPLEKRTPFYVIKYYTKDYPNIGDNTLFIANYYSISCDEKPDLTKTSLTEGEMEGNFELRYINKNEVLRELEISLKTCTRENVVKDTINVVKEYLKSE